MLHEKDFIMREIERIVAVIARILGLKQHQDLDGALEVIQHSYVELFGPLGEFLAQADVGTVVQLLTDPVQLAGLARLLRVEADLRASAGDHEAAEGIRLRALELAIEAYKRDEHGVADAKSAVLEVSKGISGELLSPEHGQALREIIADSERRSKVQDSASGGIG